MMNTGNALLGALLEQRLKIPNWKYMKKFKKQSVEVLYAYICDKCGREAKDADNILEAQEFVSIEHKAGYASIFGDGNELTIDLCQHCFKELLGSWVKLKMSNSLEIY